MDSSVIVALLGLVGTFFGSMLGVVGGQKLNEFRLKKLEEKQTEHDKNLKDTDKKVVNLQIAVTAVEQRVDAHDAEIDQLKSGQEKLTEFHFKKE